MRLRTAELALNAPWPLSPRRWRIAPPAFTTRAYARDELGRRIGKFARRRQLAIVVRAAPRVLTGGLALILVGAVVAVLLDAAAALPLLAAVVGALAAAALLAVAGAVPSMRRAALAVDLRLQLHERLSTAVAGLPNGDEMVLAQRADALAAAESVQPREAFPLLVDKRDVLMVCGALGLVALWLWVAAVTPLTGFFAPRGAPLGPQERAGESQAPGAASPQTSSAELPPQLAAQMERLNRAVDQLRAQIDPEARASQEQLGNIAEGLRRSSEARQLGRALEGRDLEAAAAEARQLANRIADLNSGQLEELAGSLGRAAEEASADPALAGQLESAAQAVQDSRLGEAREALRRLGETLAAIDSAAAGNRALEREIAGLERDLAELQTQAEGAGTASSTDTLTIENPNGGAAMSAAGDAGAGAGRADGQARGGGYSSAAGQELPGPPETLAPQQRLAADGRLEIIELAPTDEGSEQVQRPALELGAGTGPSFDPAAGSRGFAAGRGDVSRAAPLELRAVLDRYFSSP